VAAFASTFGEPHRRHRRTPSRHRTQLGLVEVAVDEHRRGARDGRRGHHEHVGLVAETLQHGALLDAEPVLLVDHDEAEVRERRVAVQQRVGSHDDVDVAGMQSSRDPATLRRGRAVREQRDADRPLREQRPLARERQPLQQVAGDHRELLGEHLGRRHERALVAALHRDEERGHRDDGLPRAHLALQQAVHRHRRREVGLDHVEGGVLVRGEVVRERLEEPGEEVALDPVLDPAALGLNAPLAHDERDLDAEELVEAQAPLRLARVLGALRLVDVAVGPGAVLQVLQLGTHLGRERVRERAREVEDGRDRALDLPGRHVRLPRLRVDGHDDPGLGVAGAPEHVDDRVRELALPAEQVELPVERDLGAHRELALAPRLVEEDEVQQPRVVLDDRLDHLLALARRPRRDPLHLGDDRRLLSRHELRDLRLAGAVVVAPGVVLEQVEHRLDRRRHQREPLEQLRREPVDVPERDLGELPEGPGSRGYSTPIRYG
jgi:hypothetical protein